MMVELDTKDKQQVHVHYVNTPVPCVVEENFGGYFHDNDDFELAAVLQDQESLYQSLQKNAQVDMVRTSSTISASNHNCDRSVGEGNSSETPNVNSQLAIDEALAKEFQELENQLANTSIRQIAGTIAGTSRIESMVESGEPSSSSTSSQVARQDDIDPDSMTYEELQTLGEAMGAESRGLPDELISFLPTSTYKIGLFSRKDKHEECVICCMTYKNRDKLMTLPCRHQYHKSCVARWLKMKKVCPVCNEEVFGP